MDKPSEHRSPFSPRRQKLFAALLKREGIAVEPRRPIPRRDGAEPPPLSFAQQRLWVFDQIEPGSSAYNIPIAVRMTGALDTAALERSLRAIVGRHEVLRTTFPAIDGQPVQMIAPVVETHHYASQGQNDAPVETHHYASLQVIDLRDHPDREAEAQRLTNREAQQPFDLGRGPLLRSTLLRLAEDEHLLLLTTHHIISDGWSQGILIGELASLYAAYIGTPSAPLSALPIQYADFALWQRRWLDGEGGDSPLQQQLEYWRRRLDGAPPLVTLPLDRPRPAVQRFQGTRESLVLPRRLSEQLRALSRDEGATLFMVLLAALQTLLYRYSGQDDIIVSTGIANRGRPETEPLIGCLINILLLRANLAGNPSFRQLLGQVRHTVLEAQANQDLPFEKLLEQLHPQRDPSYSPLTQVMFVLHNAPVAELKLPGLTLWPIVPERAAAQYDLLLHLTESDGELTGALEYNTTLFEAATIARLLGHFEVLLDAIAADPDRRIDDLPLLTAPELRAFEREWNATGTPFPHDRCLHELFEDQARRQPDEVALLFDHQEPRTKNQEPRTDEDAIRNTQYAIRNTLTYAELNARANQLAHHLRSLGVGPNTLVGLCMERSPEVVVGVLGILKAGGAYVPLDPDYPAERLRYMLEDALVSVVLTRTLEDGGWRMEDGGSRDGHPPSSILHPQPKVVDLIADWPTIAQQPATNPQSGVSPDHLVYVIYTSGSTGRPKGVLLDHRGRVNNFCDFNRRFAIGPGDRVFAVSSLSFDMSAYDMLGTLAAGAAIVMPAPADARDPARWAELMARHQVTIWHSAPALLDLLVDYLSKRPERVPHSLRLALLGGDWIPVRLPDRLKILVEDVQVISLGGATEASMDSTIYPIEQVDPSWTSIPYGRPMANQLSYILDARLNPVPIGVPGELYLGGVGLAWGYLNRPELTAERFVPNPFLRTEDRGLKIEDSSLAAEGKLSSILYPLSSTRLYKTGDLARYFPDGTLELLGRMDHQVKIRGLRIELGEIEAALNEHHAVQDCVVVARNPDAGRGEDVPGEKRLVAYLVPTTEDRGLKIEDSSLVAQEKLSSILYPLSSDLRQFLRDRLPDYMIPSAFVLLDALPLSPNGKLDRRALPAPSASRPEVEAAFVAPRGGTEERLAQIWSEVLGIARVGIHDNFFDLGGDSLKAIRAVYRAAGGLTLVDLFQNPTVAALAERLERGLERQRSLLYALTPPSEAPALALVCVPYSGGTAIVYQPLARALPPEYALYSLLLPGHDVNREDEDLPVIGEVAPRCVEEIAAKVAGPLALFGHCGGAALTIELARQLEQRSIPLRAVCIAGAFPLPESSRMRQLLARFWPSPRFASDQDLVAYIQSLGGFDDVGDPEELRFLLRSFRHDGLLALEYFRRTYRDKQSPKLAAPIVCIVGDQDPFTRNFPKRYREWEHFSDTVKLVVIKDAQHYFVKHQAQEVANIIVGLPELLLPHS